MNAFILGPSEWRSRSALSLPEWLLRTLPSGWGPAEPLQPIDLRAALVGLCRANSIRATMMELHEARRGETHTSLFRRIEQDEHVDRYIVVWLPGCKRSGLDVEIGALLTRMDRGEPLDVRVLAHADAATIQRGTLVGLERGHRTRYYADLSSHATAIVPWRELDELVDAVLVHATTPP